MPTVHSFDLIPMSENSQRNQGNEAIQLSQLSGNYEIRGDDQLAVVLDQSASSTSTYWRRMVGTPCVTFRGIKIIEL